MKARPGPTAAKRLRGMHEQLARAFGPQRWWPARNRFEVILGAYLTQNTSWKAVEMSLRNLRRADAIDIGGIRALPIKQLEELIRPSGFHTRKARALKAFVAMLDADFQGSLDILRAPPTAVIRAKLLSLPGVGPETADAILLYALGHPVPVGDEYLRRIVDRHQLIDPAPQLGRRGYDALVQLTRDAFAVDSPKDQARLFNEFHALVVAVGKAYCGRTADCGRCPLSGDLRPENRNLL